jgi:hypothetical protein
MTVRPEQVRALLDADRDDAVLVLTGGKVQVVAETTLQIAAPVDTVVLARRDDLIERAGGELRDEDLSRIAAQLDSDVAELGGAE